MILTDPRCTSYSCVRVLLRYARAPVRVCVYLCGFVLLFLIYVSSPPGLPIASTLAVVKHVSEWYGVNVSVQAGRQAGSKLLSRTPDDKLDYRRVRGSTR